jgi:hypothetical protein
VAGPTTLPAVAGVLLALAPTPITDQALRAEVDRLTAAVSTARHLPFHGPLAARAVGREALSADLTAALAAGRSTTPARAEERLLARLALLPPDAEYEPLLADKYARAGVPSYDPTTRRLSVPDFVPLDAQALPLAHEVAHAVVDQRFGIRRLLQIQPDGSHRLDGDAERARLALVEGDTMLSALELADPSESFLDRHALAALEANLRAAAGVPHAPPWFAALDRFEHVDGLAFVARVRARRPWSAVDALWSDPPASSAEVLHPERYETCQGPIAVPEDLLPTLPEAGRPEASDVLGELVVRTWLAEKLPPEIAARAAAGWAGDRAGVYQLPRPATPDAGPAPPTSPPLAWLTIWDDGAEAEDFERAALAMGVHAVARRGDAVALLLGVPEPEATPVLAAMLDGWRRQQTPTRKASARARKAAPATCSRRETERPQESSPK